MKTIKLFSVDKIACKCSCLHYAEHLFWILFHTPTFKLYYKWTNNIENNKIIFAALYNLVKTPSSCGTDKQTHICKVSPKCDSFYKGKL